MSRAEGVISKIDKVIGILSAILVAVAALYLVGMVLMMVAYIFIREVLVRPIMFVEEYSAYGVVIMTYFAAAYTLRSGGHINVNVVIRRLHHRAREGLLTFSGLFALLMLGYMLSRSISWFRYTLTYHVRSEFTLTPMWIPTLSIPIGLGVFGLAIALWTVQRVISLVKGAEEEVKEVAAL